MPITVDPQVQAMLGQLNLMTRNVDLSAAPNLAVAARQQAAQISRAFAGTSSDEAGCDIADIMVSGGQDERPARLYQKVQPLWSQPPLIVFLHGGGWALNDLDAYDGLMKSLCNLSGATFVSVDYRLAPEHGFPSGLDDARAAVKWAFVHAERLGCHPTKVSVMGDSSGGNLAAVVAQLWATEPQPLAAQYLLYPVMDVSRPHAAYPSRIAYGDGNLFLTRDAIDGTTAWYLASGGTTADDPRVSPINTENLRGVAPAFVILASLDPLLDEGLAYAAALQAANVPVTTEIVDGAIHGFMAFGVLDLCHLARHRLAEDVRSRLGTTD